MKVILHYRYQPQGPECTALAVHADAYNRSLSHAHRLLEQLLGKIPFPYKEAGEPRIEVLGGPMYKGMLSVEIVVSHASDFVPMVLSRIPVRGELSVDVRRRESDRSWTHGVLWADHRSSPAPRAPTYVYETVVGAHIAKNTYSVDEVTQLFEFDAARAALRNSGFYRGLEPTCA